MPQDAVKEPIATVPHALAAQPAMQAPALPHGAETAPVPAYSVSSRTSQVATPGADSATQEAFAALDAGSGVSSPGWIHAGSQRAEAGFQDPALGWVGVRADLSGGGVHASLMPDSTEAAQVLSGHLAGLSAFLAEQHTPLATLTLSDPAASGPGNVADHSLQQGASENSGQHAAQEPQTGLQSSGLTAPDHSAQIIEPLGNDFDSPFWINEGQGVHISVMA